MAGPLRSFGSSPRWSSALSDKGFETRGRDIRGP